MEVEHPGNGLDRLDGKATWATHGDSLPYCPAEIANHSCLVSGKIRL